jgi:hypothetical protein
MPDPALDLQYCRRQANQQVVQKHRAERPAGQVAENCVLGQSALGAESINHAQQVVSGVIGEDAMPARIDQHFWE